MVVLGPSSSSPASRQDVTADLPLQLIKSQIIAPAPSRSPCGLEPIADFLLEFAGYSWIAYGASSLVVISHFPNPSKEAETKIGPIFRQAIGFDGDPDVGVSSVSWSPAAPSVGELAVASGGSIFLLSCTLDEASSGSFYWAQIAMFVQSTKVEALKWTGSADGIISVGDEVVLWRRGEPWGKVWSFKPDVPQALVSSCWSANELLATAPLKNELPPCYKGRDCALIFQGSTAPEYPLAELQHPMPVTMIQFRPSSGRLSFKHESHAPRPILLTCCVDGAARLWGEIDDGNRKAEKDHADYKSKKLSFCVIAQFEVNQALNGFLGSNVFISWATDVEGVVRDVGKDCVCSFLYHSSQDTAGMCEWVLALSPTGAVTLWAIHSLDDSAPSRIPRVTLWKRLSCDSFQKEASSLFLIKAMIMRNRVSGPPLSCDLVQFSSCHMFAWSHFYSQASSSLDQNPTNEYPSESTLSPSALGVLDVMGHTGKILQVAIHPFINVDLAASLDDNGTIILWSFSRFFSSCVGLPALTPFWKPCGKTFSDHSLKYKCLNWAPVVLDKERFLLIGHETGVDCLLFESVIDEDGKFDVHNLFSIPCRIEGHGKGLSKLCCIPLPGTCHGNFFSNKFLLVAIWMDEFLALSWEVTIHRFGLEGSSCSGHMKEYVCKFPGKTYSIAVHPCSSSFPVPHNHDKIMSCDVVCPSDLIFSEDQRLNFSEKQDSRCHPYHMTTGCIGGKIKLWRSIPTPSVSSNTNWLLVGMLSSDHGPIVGISPSPFCEKIASVSVRSHSTSSTSVCIWDCIPVQSVGGFMQEEKLCFDGEAVSTKWLKLGNGQLLLGICMRNEFHVYISRRLRGLGVLKSEKPPNEHSWVCISVNNALPPISDFLWGPKGSLITLHAGFLSVFSHFMLSADSDVFNKQMLAPVFVNYRKLPMYVIEGQCQSTPSLKSNSKGDLKSVINAEGLAWSSNVVTRISFWSLSQISEKVAGCLPLFHPVPLLLNMCSGNWKRSLIALRHLVEKLFHSDKNKRGHSSTNILTPVSLQNYLEGIVSVDSSHKMHLSSSELALSLFTPVVGAEVPGAPHASSLSRSEFDDFRAAFDRLYDNNHIDEVDKIEAVAIISILEEVSNPHSSSAYGSLDEFGKRFWIAVRFQKLCLVHKTNQLSQSKKLAISSFLICWAFHSDCHEVLFNSLLPKEPSWEEMRNFGVGFWCTNVAELRVKIEGLARQKYIKRKDPKDCALLYIALNRVQVLAGLFRISKDDKDKVLAGFLSRNFQDEKNRAAALKNAYVLMGKHQLELAVAFFLLGGDTSSAVMVCAKNLEDEQLALVICRLVEGYGGSLECNLISKFLLPSALSKGDLWMASLLEWVLGNYFQSILRVLGVEMTSEVNVLERSFFPSFLDPVIGQYCLMLALKPCVKNAIGEFKATIFCRLMTSLNASSLAKCGLPLEALECLMHSFSLGISANEVMVTKSLENCYLVEAADAVTGNGSENWISMELCSDIIFNRKLSLSIQYITHLLRMHPSFAGANFSILEGFRDLDFCSQQYEKSLQEFQVKFTAEVKYVQKKFGLLPYRVKEMVILHSYQNGLEFIGHYILRELLANGTSKENSNGHANLFLCPTNLLHKATEEFSSLLAAYVSVSCMSNSRSRYVAIDCIANEGTPSWVAAWAFSNQGIAGALSYMKAMMQLFFHSYPKETSKFFSGLDLCLSQMLFVSAWHLKNFKALLLIISPILVAFMQRSLDEIQMKDLLDIHSQVIALLTQNSLDGGLGIQVPFNSQQQEQSAVAPNGVIWPVTHSSFWAHMSDLLTNHIGRFSGENDNSRSSSFLPSSENDNNEMQALLGSVSKCFFDFIKMNCANISLYCSKLFSVYLLHAVNTSDRTILYLLQDFLSHPDAAANHKIGKSIMWDRADKLFSCQLLWNIFSDPKMIHRAVLQEYRIWLPLLKLKLSTQWNDFYLNISKQFESDRNWDEQDKPRSPGYAGGSPVACLTPDDHPFKNSSCNDSFDVKKVLPFQSPNEIHRRNGELIEALCINSIDQHQAVFSSNRKGIVFFNWDDGIVHADKSQYVWGEAELPYHMCSASETPTVSTHVSPGGLSRTAIGTGFRSRPGTYLTGGGAFGIPGYAGVGASHLGWGGQEQFLDPQATIESVRSRAFSSHPSKPLFLVGSSDAHIYLWKFGMEKATATYCVLPAANMLSTYALSSISSIKFDHCGDRFVTAAIDGTICTWKLEDGDRGGLPMRSSVCFSYHSSDVAYVTTSGSVVAAAGYTSSGLNVVVWDTVAPRATSQASIMCHEGGAHSLAAFDNDIGCGSVSPLILTGGESGDVGLHDFRYIASGRTKKQMHPDVSEHNMSLSTSKTGDQNRNGMLWYIPKAHSAAVTKIATIPNTSLFLTGSKDGDVKLWDAKMARLVYHWPKLHERHMFFQHSSRGSSGFFGGIFGGIVRAAVTDIQVTSHGFLTCGGDGLVKFVKLQDLPL